MHVGTYDSEHLFFDVLQEDGECEVPALLRSDSLRDGVHKLWRVRPQPPP